MIENIMVCTIFTLVGYILGNCLSLSRLAGWFARK